MACLPIGFFRMSRSPECRISKEQTRYDTIEGASPRHSVLGKASQDMRMPSPSTMSESMHEGNIRSKLKLFAAIDRDDLDEVKRLLDTKNIGIDEDLDFSGNTAVHFAVWRSTKILQLLIDRGASLSKVNYDGLTPLAIACVKNSVVSAEMILREGVNPNNEELDGIPLLLGSVVRNNLSLAKILVKYGCDVNPNQQYGTPLVTACLLDNVEFVDFLLKSGAKPSLANSKTGTTAMQVAKENGNELIINLLNAYEAKS